MSSYTTGLFLLIYLTLGFSSSVRKVIFFEDQGDPNWVALHGSLEIDEKVFHSGKESISIKERGFVSLHLDISEFPVDKAFLKFHIKKDKTSCGERLNVALISRIRENWHWKSYDADFYISPDYSKAGKDGFTEVKIPFINFRNIERFYPNHFHGIRFQTATKSSGYFWIDKISIEESPESLVPAKYSPPEIKIEKIKITNSKQKNEMKKNFLIVFKTTPIAKVNGIIFKDGKGIKAFKDLKHKLIWDRKDEKGQLQPNGTYILRLEAFYRKGHPLAEPLIAKSITTDLKIENLFASFRESKLYLQTPGNWPYPFYLSHTKFKGKPAVLLGIEVKLTDKVFVETSNIDVIGGEASLSSSTDENLAFIAQSTASSHTGNIHWGHVGGLNDGVGGNRWIPTPDHLAKRPVWFGLIFPREVVVNKIGIYPRQYGGGFKEIEIIFSRGKPIIIELPKGEENNKMFYFKFPPRKTKYIKGKVLSYHKPAIRDQNGPAILEFEAYPPKENIEQITSGHLITSDLAPSGLLSWVKFKPIQDTKGGRIRWYYSDSSGESWNEIPKSGKLKKASIKKGKLRLKAVLTGKIAQSPVIKGFKIYWIYSTEKTIAEPLNPKTCKVEVKDGSFYDQTGKRLSLCGIFTNQFLGVGGRLTVGSFPSQEALELRAFRFAQFGVNVVRLGISGTLLLPDANNTFPDSPRYPEIMKKYKFDPGYIKLVDTTIDTLAKYGIYTILEFHDNPPFGHWSVINIGKEEGLPKEEHYKRAVEICVDEGKIYDMWSWVAKYYRDNPYILGFEIPWNEPLIGGSERTEKWNRLYYKICRGCTRAIKKQDPNRIVLLGPNIWNGPGKCKLSSSLWDFPKGVDALHFHLYPRGSKNNMRRWYDDILRIFYITGSHKPLVVTEGHPMYILWDKVDMEKGNIRRGTDCIFSVWYAAALQAIAWWGHHGIYDFSDSRSRFHSWLQFWREHPPKTLEQSEFAIICNSHLDWKPLVYTLFQLNSLPFVFLYDHCLAKNPDWLERYKGVILIRERVPPKVLKILMKSDIPRLELSIDDLSFRNPVKIRLKEIKLIAGKILWLKFISDKACKFDVYISDDKRNEVKSWKGIDGRKGVNIFTWDLKDKKGKPIKDGKYYLVVNAFKDGVRTVKVIFKIEREEQKLLWKEVLTETEITIYDDEEGVRIRPFRGGKIERDKKIRYSGNESLKVHSENESGVDITFPHKNLSYLSLERTYLKFYVKKDTTACGQYLHINLISIKPDRKLGWSDGYFGKFRIDFSGANKQGWTEVKIPLYCLRGIENFYPPTFNLIRIRTFSKDTGSFWIDKVSIIEVQEKKKSLRERLIKFFNSSKINFNIKNPKNLLLAYGKDSFIVHEFSGKGGNYRVYPKLNYKGKLKVIDYATNKVVIKGDRKEIYEKGFDVELKKFRTKFFKILR